jgi:Family of unknown function (DUF5670)
MLWIIFFILMTVWFIALVTSYTLGGFIHLLLILAVAVMMIEYLLNRRPV